MALALAATWATTARLLGAPWWAALLTGLVAVVLWQLGKLLAGLAALKDALDREEPEGFVQVWPGPEADDTWEHEA